MLRCGGAFSELVQIGRKVEELQGYTGRIVELFDALSSKKAAPRYVATLWRRVQSSLNVF